MKIKNVLFYTLFCLCLTVSLAEAKSFSIVADVESMQWFKEQGSPLLKSAGVEDKIHYRIINSSEINAFVTPDKNINFFNGLIEKAKTQDELIAVLAHEIGHLKGLHHFRIARQADNITLPTIISGIAGIGAAIAGAPQAGMALVIGGQAASASQMLRYSRTQEREADHIAYNLLTENQHSLKGLVDFFKVIKQNELLYSRVPPAYLLSHPVTAERVDAAKNKQKQLLQNKYFKEHEQSEDAFLHMKARLFALTHSAGETLRKFPAINKDSPSVYARAIAYAIQGKGQEALVFMNKLRGEHKNNPYFHDMAGQIHVDIGQLQKGAQAFESALKIKPELFLTRLHLAEAYLALDELDKSYDNFSVVRQEMPEWPSVWHGLGIVYGKKGYIGESHLALAEESLLKGEKADAKFHIKAASIYKDDMGEPAQKWLVEVQKALKEKDK